MKKKYYLALMAVTCLLISCGQAPGTSDAVPAVSSEDTAQTAPAISLDETVPAKTTDTSLSVQYSLKKEDTTGTDGSLVLQSCYMQPSLTGSDSVALSSIQALLDEREAAFWAGEKTNQELAHTSYPQDEDNGYASSNNVTFLTYRCDDAVLSLFSTKALSVTKENDGYVYEREGLNFDTQTGSLLTFSDIADDEAALRDSVFSYLGSKDDFDTWFFSKEGLNVLKDWEVFTVPYASLAGLKTDYAYTGNLEQPCPLDTDSTIDLDGDGTQDTLHVSISTNTESYETTAALTINGTDYSRVLPENNVVLSDVFAEKYYLVDLDTSDSTIEFALADYGYSDDRSTYFFRYQNGSVQYLGTIPNLLNDGTCSAAGDGTLNCTLRLNLLETAWTPAQYALDDSGKVTLVPQEWYVPVDYGDTPGFQSHPILQNVTVYTENRLDSEKKILTPEDGPVTFPATDNEHWFQVQTKIGETYYLYLKDFGTIDSDGTELDIMETFENLFLAG